MEPPRENSPSTPSRYLNSYLQQNPTELFHQNFPQRQLSNQQFYAAAAADSVTTNNKNYLKRHHQNYESERDKKYEKYDSKKIEDQGHTYDGFSNDAYSAASIATPTGSAAVTTTPQPKTGTNTKSLSNGKKTKGRVKIKMEYIDNKLRRYTTFSKRKTGIMKKAYELSTLTGTQVMLLVASETGHVYTFATRKLQPMITSEAGKTLIQTCLNSPDIPTGTSADQRMSATGFEETELNYSISDIGDNPGDKEKVRQLIFNSHQNLPQNTSHLYNLPHAQHFSHSPQSTHHFSPHFSPPQHHFPTPHFPQQSFYENQSLQNPTTQNYHSLATAAASVAGQTQSHR